MLCLKIAGWVANSVDPDVMPYSAASHLGLHHLLRPVCPNTNGKYGKTKSQLQIRCLFQPKSLIFFYFSMKTYVVVIIRSPSLGGFSVITTYVFLIPLWPYIPKDAFFLGLAHIMGKNAITGIYHLQASRIQSSATVKPDIIYWTVLTLVLLNKLKSHTHF